MQREGPDWNPIAEDAVDALRYAFTPIPVVNRVLRTPSKPSGGDMKVSRTRAYFNALLAVFVTVLMALLVSTVLGAGLWLGVSLVAYILR